MAHLAHGAPRLSPRLLLRAGLVLGLAVLCTCGLLVAVPFPALEALRRDPGGTRLLDRNGRLLSVVPARDGAFVEKRGPGEIPGACRELFVRLEDRRFFSHPGVDLFAVARAVVRKPWRGGRPAGASTITMQLARIAVPLPRTLAGKAAEAALALGIEARLTKGEILDLYLDAVPFGRNARGVGAAAWTYFGSDIGSLSRAQLLLLAVIPRNPSAFDPFARPAALADAARRLSARWSLGVSDAEIGDAVASAASARPPNLAPHFSQHAVARLRAVGSPVRTSLDADLNAFVESRIRFRLAQVRGARITNAAAVVLDNATGEVLAWVGSRDWNDTAAGGQLDGVLVRRQSASTLKPLLYAMALERGWTPATLLPDADTAFGAEELYRPVNFDRRSRGPVRLRTALASSLNVPAVFTLSRVGVADFEALLQKAGFALPADARQRWGLGAAIGNVEATLLELARAFCLFPRGGTLPPLSLVRGTGDTAEAERIFSPETAWTICSILSDPAARAAGFGTRTYFRTSFPAMFKSGTSSEFTNLWCLGATPRHTVAAWAGNFDGRAVINKTGSVVPARIVVDILEKITGRPVPFPMPAGIIEARICSLSGGGATPRCPAVRTEFFASAAAPLRPCAVHEAGVDPAALLQEAFLAGGESIRILFPLDGQVVFRDPTVSDAAQRIPVLLASRRGAAPAVFLDGAQVRPARPGGEVSVPARRGTHEIVARVGEESDRVVFRVE